MYILKKKIATSELSSRQTVNQWKGNLKQPATETVNFSPLTLNGLRTSFHITDVEDSRLLNSRRFEG